MNHGKSSLPGILLELIYLQRHHAQMRTAHVPEEMSSDR